MKISKIIFGLFVSSLISMTYAASGAAAVVAKTAGKGYSEPTRKEFLKSCIEGVEAPICECVLKKLEAKYDENKFKSLEQGLSLGMEDPDYVNFIVNSTTECGTLVDGPAMTMGAAATQPPPSSVNTMSIGGYQVTDEDLMLFMSMLQSPLFKDTFVQSCTVESMEWLGANQADKICKCAFDRLIKDKNLPGKMMNESAMGGEMGDLDKLGYGLIEPCLPKQYPAEMDNAFIKECMKAGDVNKATCECVLKGLKKSYTIRSLIKTALENPKSLEVDMTLKAAQCLSK